MNPPIELQSVVLSYGKEHADEFGGMWIDRWTLNSPLTIGFTKNVDRHRTELLARQPELGDESVVAPAAGATMATPNPTTVGQSSWPVAVVYVPMTSDELKELEPAVDAFLAGDGRDLNGRRYSSGRTSGRASVAVPEPNDHVRSRLAAEFGDRVCVARSDSLERTSRTSTSPTTTR